MATALNHPFEMTSDANRVYWTEYGDDQGTANGSVKSCPLSGCGGKPTIYAQAQINPRGIAVDAQNVYWGSATYGQVNGAIWSCPLAGCTTPTRLAVAGIPYGVSLDATYVYWVDSDEDTVNRVAKPTGSSEQVLYDSGAFSGNCGIAEPQQCLVDGAFVYFNDVSGDIYRIPILGGAPTALFSGILSGGWPLAVDATSLYFGESGSILRRQKLSGATNTVASVNDPDGIALDPSTNTIYWSDWGSGNAEDGTVGKVGIDGTGRTVLASSLATPEAVTVSGGYVFWLSNGTLDVKTGSALPITGALTRMAK